MFVCVCVRVCESAKYERERESERTRAKDRETKLKRTALDTVPQLCCAIVHIKRDRGGGKRDSSEKEREREKRESERLSIALVVEQRPSKGRTSLLPAFHARTSPTSRANARFKVENRFTGRFRGPVGSFEHSRVICGFFGIFLVEIIGVEMGKIVGKINGSLNQITESAKNRQITQGL